MRFCRVPAAHAPESQVAYVPLASPAFHSGDHPAVFVSIRPPSRSLLHILAHWVLPLSARLTVMFVPETVNGFPPACQMPASVEEGSPASEAINLDGSAACSFWAAAKYSSQVVGTVKPYLSKESFR